MQRGVLCFRSSVRARAYLAERDQSNRDSTVDTTTRPGVASHSGGVASDAPAEVADPQSRAALDTEFYMELADAHFPDDGGDEELVEDGEPEGWQKDALDEYHAALHRRAVHQSTAAHRSAVLGAGEAAGT
jgi:hypothetical protein